MAVNEVPAAFGRLCVETMKVAGQNSSATQPPSGGCVLKQSARLAFGFSGIQPPSGGCVLKPCEADYDDERVEPAAFGRLCVETQASN